MRKPRMPEHPSVDWSTYTPANGSRQNPKHSSVLVTCPVCLERRQYPAPAVAYRIIRGDWTGKCIKCRMRGRGPRYDRPDHPQVNWDDTRERIEADGSFLICVAVTCPRCLEKRYLPPNTIYHGIRVRGFSGICRACVHGSIRLKSRTKPARFVDHKGYIVLRKDAVSPEDHWLFDAMRHTKDPIVLEHRFVMAKHLGRPLTRNELVDHMDGNRGNNDLANLRIYRKGQNQPGSHNGNGTYYHEWQAALAEIARLTALLESHR